MVLGVVPWTFLNPYTPKSSDLVSWFRPTFITVLRGEFQNTGVCFFLSRRGQGATKILTDYLKTKHEKKKKKLGC